MGECFGGVGVVTKTCRRKRVVLSLKSLDYKVAKKAKPIFGDEKKGGDDSWCVRRYDCNIYGTAIGGNVLI